MRAEVTQHHSLEPQGHRQNKAWRDAILWVLLSFFLRHLKTEQSMDEKKNCLQRQKRHLTLTKTADFDPILSYWFKDFVSSITAFYCPCSNIIFTLTLPIFSLNVTTPGFIQNKTKQ